MDVEVEVKLAVGDEVLVDVDVDVNVGRNVRVGEAVHVGRGVLVGVRVHTTGVRVTVAVADRAAMNACLWAVPTTDVKRRRRSTVAVDGMEVFVAGSVVFAMREVGEAAGGETAVGRMVSVGGCVLCGDAIGTGDDVAAAVEDSVSATAGVRVAEGVKVFVGAAGVWVERGVAVGMMMGVMVGGKN